LRRHTTTRNTARDLDLVRRALGEERLSYIGYAYGSYVGAVYGTLFGQRLDRCVLDSCVHPDWLWRKQFVMQASAIRDNVDAWAAWVARRDRRYGLGRDADAVLAAVEELAGRAAAAAVPGLDRTTLDGAVGNGATLRPSWDRLAGAVAALHRGDTGAAETAVGALGEFAASGLRAGTYPSATDEQRRMRAVLTERGALPAGCRPAVLHAVTHEARWPRDPEHYREDVHRVRRDQPYGYGIVRALPWVSSFAAEPPPEEPTTLRRAGSAPGLVVQGEGDPLNHHAGAIAMAHRLGHRLVLVTDDGGHELFPDAGNADVDRIVLRYLVDGELPAAPITRVAGRPRPDVPADDASR
jgi:pimeloyl-ACP methyl ester carboxylesterase